MHHALKSISLLNKYICKSILYSDAPRRKGNTHIADPLVSWLMAVDSTYQAMRAQSSSVRSTHRIDCRMMTHIHFQLLLTVLVFIRYNAYAYAMEESVDYISTCAKRDCGFGIWNDNTCGCNCIPPYCFDELYQSCVAPGSCSNAFEGCTPYVNCPYYFNPAGNCESSPTIYPGVFAVFWDADSCCRANFPSDVSTCLDAVATSQIEASETTPAPTSVAPVVSKEISIPPIPMRLINLTAPLDLDEDQRRRVGNIIINSITNQIESELNASIQSMEVSTSMNEEEGDKILSLEIRLVVIMTTDTTYSVQETRASILKIMNNQNDNIASQLEVLFGQDIYSDSVVLYVGDTPAPTPLLQIQSSDNGNDSNNQLAVVLASLLSVLFVVACVGLLIWRRGHRKNELPMKQNVAAVDDKSIGSSILKHPRADESTTSFGAHAMDDGYDGGKSSYNMNSAYNESDFSFATIPDDSSKEGGNSVLGLLYYDGPNSSESDDEDTGHQSRAASRASRRSRRSNRSNDSRQTSTRSHKSRSSATQKSRRSNRQNPLEKLDEDTEYRHSKKRDPDGFDGNSIMSGSQSLSPTTAFSIATSPPTPMRPSAGVESVASGAAAPSIATTHSKKRTSARSRTRYPPGHDSYNKQNRNSAGSGSRSRGGMSVITDAYSVSVNSTGEHTSDLRNQPDVKF